MDLKNPVSLLQEYLVKEDVLPSYQLVDCGNVGTHEPTFGYEVKAKGVTAVGRGRSKKEAKREAAKLLLLKLKGETIQMEEMPLNSPNSVKENVVGALQEYCYQKCISLPHYELVNSTIAHSFVVKCTVASYSATGTGSTKQQAKHLAAQAMLSKFKNDEVNVSDISQGAIEAKKELIEKAQDKTMEAFEKTLQERNDGVYSSANPVKNIMNFSDNLMNRIGQRSSTLASLKDTDEEELERHENPEGLLDIIIKELGFNLKFEAMESRSSDHLCNVSVTELSINCIGTGKSVVEARKKAALNVLKVLVIMSKP